MINTQNIYETKVETLDNQISSDYYSVKDFAELQGVKLQTVYQQIKKGYVKTVDILGKKYISKNWLKEIVK